MSQAVSAVNVKAAHGLQPFELLSAATFSLHQTTCFLYTFLETGVKRDHEKGSFLPIAATTDGKAHVERSAGQV